MKWRDATIDFIIVLALTLLFYNVLPIIWKTLQGEAVAYVSFVLAYITYLLVGRKIMKFIGG